MNAEPGVDEDVPRRARGGRVGTVRRWPDAPPLLRRRQRDRAAGRCGRSAAERRGALPVAGSPSDPAEVAALGHPGFSCTVPPSAGFAYVPHSRHALEAPHAIELDHVALLRPYDRKTPWSGQTCGLPSAPRLRGPGALGLLDVARDLLDQLGLALEGPLVAQPPPELDARAARRRGRRSKSSRYASIRRSAPP